MPRKGSGARHLKTGTRPQTRRKPPEILQIEGTCPEGHKLPNRTNQGECTQLYCAGTGGSQIVRKKKRAKAHFMGELKKSRDAVSDQLKDEGLSTETSRDALADQLVKLSAAKGRQLARARFFKVPEGLEGAAAEEWSQKRAVEMLPKAMAEIDYQLTLGDDQQRKEAARDVLDINGMRKREAANGGGATIILNLNAKELPWAQKVVAKLEEGKVVSAAEPMADEA